MFNVLRLITWLPVGGIEQKLAAILPRLAAQGKCRVRVCCLRERGPLAGELEAAGVPVDVIPFRRRWDIGALRALKAYMIEHRIDVVHSHMYRSNVPATVAARLAKVPIVFSQIHNVATWESWRQLWMDRLLMRWRDAVIGVSQAVCEEAREKLWATADNTRLIYNGVDVDHYSSPGQGARRRLREEWGVAPGAVVALMLSRLHPQKNPLGLLEAFDQLADSTPALHLVYAGDGPQQKELEEAIRKRNLAERVHLIGVRRDVPDVLAASDFCVLPSFKEGFSNTILEAMAASKPVLCTHVGGNAEVVVSGKTGYIVEPDDKAGLVHGLAHLATDSAIRKVFGDAARMRVKRFSLTQMADDTMDLYEEFLKRKRRWEG